MPDASLTPRGEAGRDPPSNAATSGQASHMLDKLLGRAHSAPGSGLSLWGGIVLGIGALFLGTIRFWFFDLAPFGPSPSGARLYYTLEVVGDVFVASGALVLAFGWARLRIHAGHSGWPVIPPSGGQLLEGAVLAVTAGVCVFGTFLFIAILNWTSATGGTFGDDLPGWLDPVALVCWAAGAAVILWSLAAFATRPFVRRGAG